MEKSKKLRKQKIKSSDGDDISDTDNEKSKENIYCVQDKAIKFGDVLFIKKKWLVIYKCTYCEKRINNLNKFLRHTLNHVYAVDEIALDKLIESFEKDKSVEAECEMEKKQEKSSSSSSSRSKMCSVNIAQDSDLLLNIESESDDRQSSKLEVMNDCKLEITRNEIQPVEEGDTAITTVKVSSDVDDDNENSEINELHLDAELSEEEKEPNNDHDTVDNYEQILLELENCNSTEANEQNDAESDEVFLSETETGLEIEFLNALANDKMSEQKSMPKTDTKTNSCIKSKKRKISKNDLNQTKSFPCDICNFVLTSPGNLRKHRNRHLGIRPHLCNMCGKTFFTSTELNTHIRSHTGEKPFVCIECGASYKTSSHLLTHRRRHTNVRPYQCDVCDKSFYDKMVLKKHQQTHSTVRHFKCTYCSGEFFTHSALRQHKKVHLSSKQYECKYCHKDYVQFVGLFNHMKQAHADIDNELDTTNNT